MIGLQIGQIVSSDSSEQNGNHLVHQCEVGNIESNTSSIIVQYSDVGNMIIYKRPPSQPVPLTGPEVEELELRAVREPMPKFRTPSSGIIHFPPPPQSPTHALGYW